MEFKITDGAQCQHRHGVIQTMVDFADIAVYFGLRVMWGICDREVEHTATQVDAFQTFWRDPADQFRRNDLSAVGTAAQI